MDSEFARSYGHPYERVFCSEGDCPARYVPRRTDAARRRGHRGRLPERAVNGVARPAAGRLRQQRRCGRGQSTGLQLHGVRRQRDPAELRRRRSEHRRRRSADRFRQQAAVGRGDHDAGRQQPAAARPAGGDVPAGQRRQLATGQGADHHAHAAGAHAPGLAGLGPEIHNRPAATTCSAARYRNA